MTGAPFPADAIVPVEMTGDSRQHVGEALPEEVNIYAPVESGAYVHQAGQDMVKGTKVLSKGALLRPQEIGVLAAVGRGEVNVIR